MAYSEYDIPAENELYGGVDFVTIDEMRRMADCKFVLERDEKTGLLFYLWDYDGTLLEQHFVVEQCVKDPANVDWAKTTRGYDENILDRMQHIYENPLVWLRDLPYELTDKYAIQGKVAVEQSSEVRDHYSPDCDIFSDLIEQRVLWFADELPTASHPYLHPETARNMPKDFILWEYITSDFYLKRIESIPIQPYFDTQTFERNIDFIAEQRGLERAQKIILLLRNDWEEIVDRKLFGIKYITPEKTDAFRACLFEQMDEKIHIMEFGTRPRRKTLPLSTPNDDELDSTFSFTFRRTDNYRRMMDFLIEERSIASDADWARYALALFRANIFVHRPAAFTKWLPAFGKLFGRTVDYQEPNKLDRTPCQKSIQIYLPDK